MRDLLEFFSKYFKNKCSRHSLVDPSSTVVVTLTSHSDRVLRVFATLESLGSGILRPRRLILFLSNQLSSQPLPDSLRRAVNRGAEVIYCNDVGPHTKYFPYLSLVGEFDHPLVTVDDDIIYEPWMLKKLFDEWRLMPDVIHCNRARRARVDGDHLAPYKSWTLCRSTEPSFFNFATGVSGVIYPPQFLSELKSAGDAFVQSCPKADDIWLNVNALRAGFPVRQIQTEAIHFRGIPGSRRTALFKTNIYGAQNDIQIRSVYTPEDISLMKSRMFVK